MVARGCANGGDHSRLQVLLCEVLVQKQCDLLPFSASVKLGDAALQVLVSAQPAELTLHYCLQFASPTDFPCWPPLTVASATLPVEGLWMTTCLECFVADEVGYREFNFSPSGAWGVLDFSAYRERHTGRQWVPEQGYPLIEAIPSEIAGRYELKVSLPKSLLPATPRQLGVTAVLEHQRDVSNSYWALAHTAEKPDFHRPDSFILPWSALVAG